MLIGLAANNFYLIELRFAKMAVNLDHANQEYCNPTFVCVCIE
jgi:hypothetical protein